MNTTANVLPRPYELNDTQALLKPLNYDDQLDVFECLLATRTEHKGTRHMIPAILLPMLVHEYGDPGEFIDRTFLVESKFLKLTEKARDLGWQEEPDGRVRHEDDHTRPHATYFDSYEDLIDGMMKYGTARR